MIYFTADLHLGHRAVINMCQRPFADIEEMNRTLIANINSRVKGDDTLYILGDVAYRIPVEEVNRMLAEIKGKKILVRGNHDKQYDTDLFDGIYDLHEISYDGQFFELCHYPFEEWKRSYHGSIHLHGHQHNKPEHNELQRERGRLRFDVGVDANNFFPVSIQEILSFFERGNA